MRIGIDVRLKNETGVGRYIRNLIRLLPEVDRKNEYVFLSYPIRWHSLEEQLKLPGLLKKEHLDLVHFPYFNVPLSVPVPFVVTMHDLIVNKYATGRASTLPFPVYFLKRIGYQFVTRSAMNRALAIITPSQSTKDELIRSYPVKEEKVFVTYEGADEDSFKAPVKPSISVQPNHYILSVTNAYPHKNVERLIDVFKSIKYQVSSIKELKLVIAGRDNFFFKRLRKKTEGNETIIFSGHVTDSELSWLYQNSKGVIIPSLDEGFGLPALEAMNLEVPVAVSDIAVFHEVCQDTVYYFDPHTNESIKKAIEYLWNDSNQSQIKKAKKRAEEFKWKTMVEQTVKIYESCLSI